MTDYQKGFEDGLKALWYKMDCQYLNYEYSVCNYTKFEETDCEFETCPLIDECRQNNTGEVGK